METMPTRYPSKIGRGLVIFLVLVVGGKALLMALQNFWLGLISLIPVALFIFHLFLTTVYIIEGRNLVIRSGYLYHNPHCSFSGLNEKFRFNFRLIR